MVISKELMGLELLPKAKDCPQKSLIKQFFLCSISRYLEANAITNKLGDGKP